MKLDRAEYVEMTYFYRTFRERLEDDQTAQNILESLKVETLSSTRMPLAIDFLLAEMLQSGHMSNAVSHLKHYFPAFHAFVFKMAEVDENRFDVKTAFEILQKESEYRSREDMQIQGLFIYQFECIMRHRLGYHEGIDALIQDPFYTKEWKEWFVKLRKLLGTVELADLIYARSEFALEQHRKQLQNPHAELEQALLFSAHDGRIAHANIGKDPLYLFAGLQRHLNYPPVPRRKETKDELPRLVEDRISQLESRLKLLEMDIKGQIDLTQFYTKPANGEIKFKDD